jgi:uncharacterized protein (DUF924 family)
MTTAQEILTFWFGEPAATTDALRAKFKRWFVASPELDREIAARFSDTVERALAGELDGWRADPGGRLALIIVLDQFTRTLFRDQARAFAGDRAAQAIALAIFDGDHRSYSLEERLFLIMPLHHAEDLALQQRAGVLFEELAADAPADDRPVYAMGTEQSEKYRDIISRFGRFPHRNAALDRPSSDAERDFLHGWAERQHPTGMRK